jgi:hypothetical protein
MHTPVRWRLFLSHLAVLLTGMGLAAALAWLAVAQMYITAQSENLLAQSEVIAATLQGASLPVAPAEPYLQTANVLPGIHSRILGEQGAVVVGLPLAVDDSLVAAPAAENSAFVSPAELLQRPEIQRAMQGEAATAVSVSAAETGARLRRGAIRAADCDPTDCLPVTPLPSVPPACCCNWPGRSVAILLVCAAGTLGQRGVAG